MRDLRLLATPDASDPDTLDCHPLVREHFAEQLQQTNPAAWREGNNRLYEYYAHASAAKQLPDTIAEMTPLFAAVLHGCQAGKHQEALDEVYWKRIARGKEFFATRKLGAMGADLAALSGFFDPPWRKPVDLLSEADKGFVLNEAGFDLRALGRLADAAQPMQAALETTIRLKDWNNAARYASNLSELWLTIGDVTQALAYAKQSVDLADRSGDAFLRMVFRTTLADALHQAGRLAEAEAAFREAEEMQKQRQPEFPLLYSFQGYRYCDLLLSQGKHQEVQRRASQTLVWVERAQQDILSAALDNLSLGRALALTPTLSRSQTPRTGEGDALTYLTGAVDGLRQAGQQQYLPLGLLARAEYYRVTGALEKAARDLDEAFGIATRGGMGLFVADCHLEYARLALAHLSLRGAGFATKQSPSNLGIASQKTLAMTRETALAMTEDDAREHLAIVKKMIEKMGYHRRDGEVEELWNAIAAK